MSAAYLGGAYLGIEKRKIAGTLKMLRFYRSFIQSDSRYAECPDLQDVLFRMGTLGRDAAQARLWKLVNTAINRKAGIPDYHYDVELWRDCQLVQHLAHRNNPSGLQWRTWHPKQFRTRWIQRRYGHLYQRDED